MTVISNSNKTSRVESQVAKEGVPFLFVLSDKRHRSTSEDHISTQPTMHREGVNIPPLFR